jgi:hypothetical protein
MIASQSQRDADVQAIVADMAPIAAKEGFVDEWALYGPTLVKAHIDERIAAAENLLEAAVEAGQLLVALDTLFPTDAGKKHFNAAVRAGCSIGHITYCSRQILATAPCELILQPANKPGLRRRGRASIALSSIRRAG